MTSIKLMDINSPKNDCNRFCGPAAISAVTGMTTGKAAKLIRGLTGRSMITGTSTLEVGRALNECGISLRATPWQWDSKAEQPTLAEWFRMSEPGAKPYPGSCARSAGRVFLVDAGHHWQVVSGRRFVCSLTEKVVGLKDKSVRRRARVKKVWELIRR